MFYPLGVISFSCLYTMLARDIAFRFQQPMYVFSLLLLSRGQVNAQLYSDIKVKLSDAETTNEHRYAGVRTPLYRPIESLTGSHESSESWILNPECITKAAGSTYIRRFGWMSIGPGDEYNRDQGSLTF